LRLAQFEKEKNKILAQKDKILDAYKEEILGERNFKGKSLVEREADYRREYQEGKAFPLFALPSFIKMYEKDIARSPRTSKSLGRLRSLLSEIEDLPVVMKSLLKAHDVIRIMRNENIVLGYRPRNIIHYDEVIEKLYVEQKVDLSHSEVEKIVREVNSFSDIAKSMGISEEVVYQVKAQFR
jgi:DNA-binding Lrp family transcriptional regulator